MRIHVLSDRHIEFAALETIATDADVVVLAGDIGVGECGVRWAARALAGKEIIYVLGNHEYYGHAIPLLTQRLRSLAKACQIHLLERGSVRIGSVRFLGCTRWTDFRAMGSQPLSAATLRHFRGGLDPRNWHRTGRLDFSGLAFTRGPCFPCRN